MQIKDGKGQVRVPGPGPQTTRDSGRLAQNPVGPSSSPHLASTLLGRLGRADSLPFMAASVAVLLRGPFHGDRVQYKFGVLEPNN